MQTTNTPQCVPGTSSMPTPQELMVYQTWAKTANDSQMYRSVGKEAGIMMIMLAAREYGIGPAQALNGGLHIIEGKVELSARVMSGLIRKAKHTLEILESTDTKCSIKGTRADTGETHTASFTIEEAQKAGLIKDRGGWKKAPVDMLYARTISRLARQLFSDVIGIGYVEGEISDSRAVYDVSSDIIADNVVQPSQAPSKVIEIIPTQELYDWFDPSEHENLQTFINVVSHHYNWTVMQTIEEFLKDIGTTKQRFEIWKSKRQQ